MDVSGRMWEQLVAAGNEKRFAAGEVVLRQGDPPTHVLALISGRVKVSLTLPKGVNKLRLAMSVNQAGAGYLGVIGPTITWRQR